MIVLGLDGKTHLRKAALTGRVHHKVNWHYIAPGKPVQNAFVEFVCPPRVVSRLALIPADGAARPPS